MRDTGFDATDSYSRDDENIEDGMTEEDSPSENQELTVCFPRFVFIHIITVLSCKRTMFIGPRGE